MLLSTSFQITHRVKFQIRICSSELFLSEYDSLRMNLPLNVLFCGSYREMPALYPTLQES